MRSYWEPYVLLDRSALRRSIEGLPQFFDLVHKSAHPASFRLPLAIYCDINDRAHPLLRLPEPRSGPMEP